MRRLKKIHPSGNPASSSTRRERRARVSCMTDDAAQQSRWVKTHAPQNPEYQRRNAMALAPSGGERISVRQEHQWPSLLLLA